MLSMRDFIPCNVFAPAYPASIIFILSRPEPYFSIPFSIVGYFGFVSALASIGVYTNFPLVLNYTPLTWKLVM